MIQKHPCGAEACSVPPMCTEKAKFVGPTVGLELGYSSHETPEIQILLLLLGLSSLSSQRTLLEARYSIPLATW